MYTSCRYNNIIRRYSQSHFMCGSNFYETDVVSLHHDQTIRPIENFIFFLLRPLIKKIHTSQQPEVIVYNDINATLLILLLERHGPKDILNCRYKTDGLDF